MKKLLLIQLIICAWLFSTALYAQSPQQQLKLRQLAAEWEVISKQEKAEAIAKALQMGWPLRTEDENGRISELIRLDEGRPVYVITDNATGAALINSDELYTGGAAGLNLSGSGQTLGIWDGGDVRSSHVELAGRVTDQDGVSPYGTANHPTHVAGTLIASGVSAAAKGMSYSAALNAYDWDNDASEMATAASVGLKVSQHSYGLITGWASGNWSGNTGWHWWGSANISIIEDYNWGFYSSEAKSWDLVSYNAPNYLIVKSAGNDRGQGPSPGTINYFQNPDNSWAWEASTAARDLDGGATGFESISHSATAKNVLTVGAVYLNTTMSTFSGWGPTDDGRIKPDIVAKGVSVYSSFAGNDTEYGYYNGTSMAGPMVSGSIGLLLQHQQNQHPGTPLRSATMKGLILHTATDLGNAGPDYVYGWGLMNTQAAAKVMSDNGSDSLHIKELSLSNSATTNLTVKAKGGEPLKVTLIWTDVPGTSPLASLDPTTAMLVNDLDVRLTSPEGTIYAPYILDPANPATVATTGDNFRDNIEVIYIASPGANQIYDLTISHKGTLSGVSQAYTVIVTGNEAFEYSYLYNASDAASNYSSWTTGSNEGNGLGNWTFNSGGSGGSYLGSTGLGASTFGIYSGSDASGNYFTAQRDIDGTIPVGGTFDIDLGYTGVSIGGEIGISLFSQGVFRLGFKFIGGGSAWMLNDGGSDFSTGISWASSTPLSFTFTRGSGNVYSVQINQGAQSYTGANFTATSGTMAIDRIEIYTNKQGASQNLGFNNLSITTDFNQVAATTDAIVRGPVVVSSNLLLDNLIIETGHSLTIAPTKTLTVNGAIDNQVGEAALRLESDGTGSASLLHYTNNVPITIERYITGDANLNNRKYHTVSVPLTQSSNPVAGLFMGSYLYSFNQATQAYVSAGTSTTTPLTVDQGYLTYYPGSNTTYEFDGMANNGNFTANVAYPPFGNNFNLVPNPYPSAIDWSASSGWTKTNINNAIYIYNSASSNSSAFVWASYVGGTGTNGGSRYVPIGQGFFVQSSAGSPVLAMDNNVRLHDDTGFLKETKEMNNTLKITSHANTYSDEIVLRFIEEASSDFDGEWDALKLKGGDLIPSVFTLSADQIQLSINSIPSMTETFSVPLGFEWLENGEASLSFEGIETFEQQESLLLDDLLTGNTVDLNTQTTYNFTHQIENDPHRFVLRFMGPTGNDESRAGSVVLKTWMADGQLKFSVQDNKGNGTVEVFDLKGSKLLQKQFFGSHPVTIEGLNTASVVLLKVTTATRVFNQKVFNPKK